ncbi:TPA: signal peptidase I [Candidatus Woesearchaeota archaeon]|nr:signal peptidase I [Candidatus Woesearchaeota archaeon]HII65640.1 signal peptidase I [Candidatus Woesearchaeota archaeon]
MGFKRRAKRVWKFIWEDDSVWSWVVNIVLAFVLIKFVVYPGLGFALGTSHPVVAVISESMEHNEPFDDWWSNGGQWYRDHGISKEEFSQFILRNGFNKGDIIVLRGAKDAEVGDIIVFQSGRPDPIIHRVVKMGATGNGKVYQTKGDNRRTNQQQIRNALLDETNIPENEVIGKALFKVPFLGYIKIWAVELLGALKTVAG